MDWLFQNIIPFIVVLSVLVFVHEYGHYWFARFYNVSVESFSIGFGPEIIGWNDQHGTRWKISLIPLGGFVKMFGDMDPASMGKKDDLTQEEQKKAFHYKSLPQRAMIVFAGPLANFVFAFIAFFLILYVVGEKIPLNFVGEVSENSPAAYAGLKTGDKIVRIQNQDIQNFQQISEIIRKNPEKKLEIEILRDQKKITLFITPEKYQYKDDRGEMKTIGRLGISIGQFKTKSLGIFESIKGSLYKIYFIIYHTLDSVFQMILGKKGAQDLGGPIMIAQLSSQFAQGGLLPLINFMGILSVSLGLINLFPIPMLDGGHLLFYCIEFIRKKPVSEKVQNLSFKLGVAIIFLLMIFSTWNDISRVIG